MQDQAATSSHADAASRHPYSLNPGLPFLTHRGDPDLQDYRRWAKVSAFSAYLFDRALLQLTYDVERGAMTGHRLAYIPAPYRMEPDLIRIEPLPDVVDIYVADTPRAWCCTRPSASTTTRPPPPRNTLSRT
ncbi:DUF2290 domain-containing protein [Streptomyces adustus]|uniref:DUF2290 domain-containing protein n=1 Tax=Streptomyces adustus TaxID=1609272 RepID=UPI0037209918